MKKLFGSILMTLVAVGLSLGVMATAQASCTVGGMKMDKRLVFAVQPVDAPEYTLAFTLKGRMAGYDDRFTSDYIELVEDACENGFVNIWDELVYEGTGHPCVLKNQTCVVADWYHGDIPSQQFAQPVPPTRP